MCAVGNTLCSQPEVPLPSPREPKGHFLTKIAFKLLLMDKWSPRGRSSHSRTEVLICPLIAVGFFIVQRKALGKTAAFAFETKSPYEQLAVIA